MRPELCSAASVDRRAARAELTHPRGLHLPLRRDDGVHRVHEMLVAREGVCRTSPAGDRLPAGQRLAARYVSVICHRPAAGKERMVGIDATTPG
ncbi:hypothetical protein I553_3628 [Mycobacterium xenopi 4042]|uniref:Uncharacterized protein n=1 Tax=Mycobacterium xenopi 4042 TaxID=1299334 RepID=X7ZDI7_MYCXE|nr:hypothetical protein I553_3628 [Mycobacterium xenopi 4042]